MTPPDIVGRVRRIAWPAPSPDLRDRVLAAAVVEPQAITWSDRVWYSRAWRLSVAGAALAIVVLDQVAGVPQRTSAAPAPQALAQAQAIADTGRQVGLPPDVAASLERRALAEASAPASSSELEATLRLFEVDGGGGGR